MESVWSMMIFALASWVWGTIAYFCLERPITRLITGTKKKKKKAEPIEEAKAIAPSESIDAAEAIESSDPSVDETSDALSEEASSENLENNER